MDEFSAQDMKDLAMRSVRHWGDRLELTQKAIAEYVLTCGKALDQFDEFSLSNLAANELEELIPDEDIAREIFNVHHYQLFISVLPGVIGDDEPELMTGVLELNSYMARSSLLWAYFKGYQQGQNAPTADAFSDFISDLDLDD